MKIFISTQIFPGKRVVYDDCGEELDVLEDVQIIFKEGRNILKLIRKSINKNRCCYCVVKNFELFLYKIRSYRNVQIEVVNNNLEIDSKQTPSVIKEKVKQSYETDTKESSFICSTANFPNDKKLQIAIDRYCKIEEQIKGKIFSNQEKTNLYGLAECKKGVEKGVKISFFPNIFNSIRSSLLNSKLYKSPSMLCHEIFTLATKGICQLSDFEKLGKDKEAIHNTIKSMVFAGILIKKGDNFSVNESIKA